MLSAAARSVRSSRLHAVKPVRQVSPAQRRKKSAKEAIQDGRKKAVAAPSRDVYDTSTTLDELCLAKDTKEFMADCSAFAA
jgi:hypothetical protein